MYKSIEEYYKYIETDSSLLMDNNVALFLTSLRDKLDEGQIKANCSYELFFTDYQIVDGQIVPKYSYGNNEHYSWSTAPKEESIKTRYTDWSMASLSVKKKTY
jgi:hypothetical protein